MKKFYLFVLLMSFVTVLIAQPTASEGDASSTPKTQARGENVVASRRKLTKSQLQNFANKGNKTAMHMLAVLFLRDKANKSNVDSGVYWYGKAAEAGDGSACYYYGMIFRRPLYGRTQDFAKAAQYFYKGMQLGNERSKDLVAYFLYKGMNGKQDYDSAFLLYKELSTQAKDKKAMYFLGNFYRNGYGTTRNIDSANYWLKSSADANEKQAKHELNIAEPENPEDPIVPPMDVQTTEPNTVYRRIKHNMVPEALPGDYSGYVIRYDWSGKHVLSVFPVQATFRGIGENVTGTWIEGHDTANINATFTDSNLLFKNTKYRKIDHYSWGKHDPVQFKNARFNLLQQPDSLYITGNLQLYDLKRKLPGRPMYIHLSRVAPTGIPVKFNNPLVVKAYPNPFRGQLEVQFVLSTSQNVSVSLVSMQGKIILKEDAGLLQPGTYQRELQVPTPTAVGNYILLVKAGIESKNLTVLKTND